MSFTDSRSGLNALLTKVQSIPLHPLIDVTDFDHSTTYQHIAYDNGNPDHPSNRPYLDFCDDVKARGGVGYFLHATTDQVAGFKEGNVAHSAESKHPTKKRVDREDFQRYAHAGRWMRMVRLPALLRTLQHTYGYETEYQWVLEQYQNGSRYLEIAKALGMIESTLVTYLLEVVPALELKAAHEIRVSRMNEQVDKLFDEVTTSEFDSDCEMAKVDLKSKVIQRVGPHLKLRLTAFHKAYRPDTDVKVSETQGVINISYGAPTAK